MSQKKDRGTLTLKERMSAAKNTMKGKMGMVEISKESMEIVDDTKILAQNKEHLKLVLKALQREALAEDRLAVEIKSTAKELGAYGVTSSERGDDGVSALATLMRGASATLFDLQGLREEYGESRLQRLMTELRSMLDEDVAEALEAKKQHERVKIQYDVAVSNVKSLQGRTNVKPEKVAEAERQKAERWAEYLECGAETHDTMESANDHVEWATLQALTQAMQRLHEYHERCAQITLQLRPLLESSAQAVHELQKAVGEKAKVRAAHRVAVQQRIQSGPDVDPATQTFGLRLEAVSEREGGGVPAIVTVCVGWIEQYALQVDGIFRLSGTLSDIQALQKECNRTGRPPELTPETNPHVVTGLLKYYFRDLPEPLLPYSLFERFIHTALLESEAAQLAELTRLMAELAPLNRRIFARMVGLAALVARYEQTNRMTHANMARVIAPSLVWAPEINPDTLVMETQAANALVELMIRNAARIFPEFVSDGGPPPPAEDKPPSRPPPSAGTGGVALSSSNSAQSNRNSFAPASPVKTAPLPPQRASFSEGKPPVQPSPAVASSESAAEGDTPPMVPSAEKPPPTRKSVVIRRAVSSMGTPPSAQAPGPPSKSMPPLPPTRSMPPTPD